MTLRLLRCVGELDAARLHPPAGQDLGLDDGRRAELLRDLAGLGGRPGEPVARHRNSGFRDDLPALELEEAHAARNPSVRVVSTLRTVLRPLLIALLALALAPAAASAAVLDIKVTPEGRRRLRRDPHRHGQAHRPLRRSARGPQGAARGAAVPVQGPQVQAGGDRDERPRRALRPRARVRPQPAAARRRARVRRSQRRRAGLRLPALCPDLRPRPPQRDPARPDLHDAEGHPAHQADPVLRRQGGQEVRPAGREGQDQADPEEGKRVKGRFRATTQVRIPKAWKGRFRYASCFPYNAGMGNPKLGCPKKSYRFWLLERPREQVRQRRAERRRDLPAVAVREPAQLEHDAGVVGGDDDLAAVERSAAGTGPTARPAPRSRSGARRRGRRRTRGAPHRGVRGQVIDLARGGERAPASTTQARSPRRRAEATSGAAT